MTVAMFTDFRELENQWLARGLNGETYFLTYLLTPWNRVLLAKLSDSQPGKKFPALYGTRR